LTHSRDSLPAIYVLSLELFVNKNTCVFSSKLLASLFIKKNYKNKRFLVKAINPFVEAVSSFKLKILWLAAKYRTKIVTSGEKHQILNLNQ
jgi:hypothetical protein